MYGFYTYGIKCLNCAVLVFLFFLINSILQYLTHFVLLALWTLQSKHQELSFFVKLMFFFSICKQEVIWE